MKLALRGVKRKQPKGVGRAIRDHNCAKLFGWSVDTIDHTPADRLNEMLTVQNAIDDELERKRKLQEAKARRARKKAGKKKR